jgi:hypothetical protein
MYYIKIAQLLNNKCNHSVQKPLVYLEDLSLKYSRRSFTPDVWDLTCSRLMLFPEFRYGILIPEEYNDRKKTFQQVWYGM